MKKEAFGINEELKGDDVMEFADKFIDEHIEVFKELANSKEDSKSILQEE